MLVRVRSPLNASTERVWQLTLKTSTLAFIASPLLTFRPRGGQILPAYWSQGQLADLNLFLFGFIPLGRHQILPTRIESASHTIESDESGSLIRSWRHTIRVQAKGENKSMYEDEVSIDAGLLTLPVWLAAIIFYHHRHRKWGRLLASTSNE